MVYASRHRRRGFTSWAWPTACWSSAGAATWWMAPTSPWPPTRARPKFLVVTLASQNTPLAVIAVTMLLSELPPPVFAFSFPLHVIEGRFARLFSICALVDQKPRAAAARPNGWTKRLDSWQCRYSST